jgi:transketolase
VRAEFIAELTALARIDSRVILLTADLGFSVIEQYVDEFPDRFFNVGVAEQNMMGLATGLAREGYTPFTYSIATFASMRPYEIIRNGPALHELPVRIVGAGGGFDYGHGGVTHYALEDIAILRAQPRVVVAVPADADQARAALRASASHPGPIYYRIGRESRPVVGLEGRFALGRLEIVRASPQMSVAFLACGPIAHEAVAAAACLQERGVSAGVAVVSTFNPFPGEGVREFIEDAALVVTVESHYRTGGLGSATAEVMAESGLRARLLRMGIKDMPSGLSGSPAYMLERNGLSALGLEDAVVRALAPQG